jgi:hypothetical protein
MNNTNNKFYRIIIISLITIFLSWTTYLIIFNYWNIINFFNSNKSIEEILEFMEANNLRCENNNLILLWDKDDDVYWYAIKDYGKSKFNTLDY